MYLYYAIFSYEDGAYNISFPDLPGCLTFGSDMQEALHMAKDALEGYLIVLEDDKDGIPVASEPQNIELAKGDLLIPIEANTKLARIKEQSILTKKTLTIPKYLDELGTKEKINFSALPTESLKEKLDAK